jgi:hypothetical protein
VNHSDSEKRLSDGERLRSRALRALFGLLIEFQNARDNSARDVFERFKFETAYIETCLPALVALYGYDLQELTREARGKGIEFDSHVLELQLIAAGVPIHVEQ